MKLLRLLAALLPVSAYAAPDCSIDSGAVGWSSGSNLTVSPAGGAPSSGEVIFLGLNWTASVAGAWPTSYSAPMGFAHLDEHNLGGEAGEYGELNVWYKIAGGSEPSSYQVGWTGGTIDSASLGVLVCSGANSMTPVGTSVDNGGGGPSDSSWDIPALTTTANNSVDLVFIASNGDTTSGGSLSAWGDSLIERVDFSSGFSLIGMATAVRASAGAQGATTVTGPANNNVTIRVELFEASASAPAFDGTPTLSIIDHDTYRLTYDADAVAQRIFVMAKLKDASTPTCADVEAGTGAVGTATENTTGSSDTIDINVSSTFPIHDVYWCLEQGTSNYSTLGVQLDALLNPPSGLQHLTITSVSMSGLLFGSGATAGDILQASLQTMPNNYDIILDSDGDFFLDSGGDESKQTFSAWFYDASMTAWSSMSMQQICVNNAVPRVAAGSYPFERSVIEDIAISAVNLVLDAVDDDGDAITVTLQSGSLPTGLSLGSNQVTGTPTTPSITRTVQRYTDPCNTFVDLDRTWIVRPERPTFVGAIANLSYTEGVMIPTRDFATEFSHEDATPPAVTYTFRQLQTPSVETLTNGAAGVSSALTVDDASGISVGQYISTMGSGATLVLAKYTNTLELASAISWIDNENIFLWDDEPVAVDGLTLDSSGTLDGTPTTVGVTNLMRVRATDANTRIKDSTNFSITVGPAPGDARGGMGLGIGLTIGIGP